MKVDVVWLRKYLKQQTSTLYMFWIIIPCIYQTYEIFPWIFDFKDASNKRCSSSFEKDARNQIKTKVINLLKKGIFYRKIQTWIGLIHISCAGAYPSILSDVRLRMQDWVSRRATCVSLSKMQVRVQDGAVSPPRGVLGQSPWKLSLFWWAKCWNSSFMASFFRIDSLFFEFESFLHFWDCSWSFKDLPPPTPSPFMKILWFTRPYPLLLRSFNDLPESLPLSSAALYK